MSTSAVEPRTTTTSQPLLPPEEKFWQRYSPHSEAPVSGVSSFVLHALAIGLLIGLFALSSVLHEDDENRSLPVDPVRLGFNPGGGGQPGGKDNSKGNDKEGDEDQDPDPSKNSPELPPMQELNPVKKVGISAEFADDKNAQYLVEKGNSSFNSFAGLESEARETLRKAVRSGAGQGGSGSGGGRDSGTDKGEGGGRGEGKGQLTQREKRVLRWAMTFNTSSGADYKSQLAGLGAMVAVPVAGQEGKFLLIRNLNNPVAREEDVTKLGLIYWIDDKPASVGSLFSVLPGISRPEYFVAFFPTTLEKKLLEMEMDFAGRKYNTRDEDRIHETKFDVFRSGSGYDVRVREVYLKR